MFWQPPQPLQKSFLNLAGNSGPSLHVTSSRSSEGISLIRFPPLLHPYELQKGRLLTFGCCNRFLTSAAFFCRLLPLKRPPQPENPLQKTRLASRWEPLSCRLTSASERNFPRSRASSWWWLARGRSSSLAGWLARCLTSSSVDRGSWKLKSNNQLLQPFVTN